MPEYIETQEGFEKLVARLEGSELIGIDTEFIREKHYYAQLCLLQVNNTQIEAIIDPLKVEDLSSFASILTDENCTKIFHAGEQDIEILYLACGVAPRPIFDTQIAAAALGMQAQIGYGTLVENLLKVSLPKSQSFSDWSKRPLTDAQLDYAIEDVRYLPKLYEKLRGRLQNKDRLDWLIDDFAAMCDKARYDADPREMWKKIKRSGTLTPQQAAVAREVAAWREEEARTRNLPRKWVLGDDCLLEIARRAPKTQSGIGSIQDSERLSSRDRQDIIECVKVAQKVPTEDLPVIERPIRPSTDQAAAVDLLSAALKLKANELHVATSFIASHDDLIYLVCGKSSRSALMQGWRYDVVGKELLEVLEGNRSFHIEEGKVQISERSQDGEPS